MYESSHRNLRGVGLIAIASVLVLSGLPAAAQDSAWSIGLGVGSGEAAPDNDSVRDIDLNGITLFGRWQHQGNGWGAMAEIRGGEDDEKFIELDYGQFNLCATYTWRRDKLVRPFVKFGLSNTDVELAGGASDDDTAAMLGGGLEVGRGRWAFHFSVDGTDPDIAVIDPDKNTAFGQSTAGVTFRF